MQERGTPAKQRLYKNRFEKSRRFFISPVLNIDNPPENDIIRTQKLETAVKNVNYVGKIDREIYKCITEDITTDEVIITDERVEHIKINHPYDYERYCSYIPDIIAEPDYIVQANKPNTGVLLKDFRENNERFKLILRLKIEKDPKEYRNSVISFWKIGEETWKKTMKNKKILYKHE